MLLTNTAVFGLLRIGAPEGWAWLALFASYVPLFAFLVRDWRHNRARNPVGRRHLWSVWIGHAAACLAVFVALRIAAGPDVSAGFTAGYAACAGVSALAFAVMGSLFSGRSYLMAAAWLGAAVAIAAAGVWGPLLYGALMAACSLVSGLQLRDLIDPGETAADGENRMRTPNDPDPIPVGNP